MLGHYRPQGIPAAGMKGGTKIVGGQSLLCLAGESGHRKEEDEKKLYHNSWVLEWDQDKAISRFLGRRLSKAGLLGQVIPYGGFTNDLGFVRTIR
jgi:hypothetical protein